MRKLSLKELGRLNVEAFKKQEKTPMIVVLDNVRSALNVGSVFRTTDAFVLEKIFLCGITAKPPHREILKTAIGATESMEWEYAPSTLDTVQHLKEEGFEILAVEQADENISLQSFDIQRNKKYVLVFGNEVNGVGEEVMKVVDACLEVPQFGTKHSLNIAVCVGIVVWELFKKIKFGTPS